MKITATIMAHPNRYDAAYSLFQQLLNYDFCAINVAWDQGKGEWDTGSRALRQGIGKGSWHVVIQDDAVLTPNFYENIEGAILALQQKALISLYTGTARPMPDRVKTAVNRSADGSWLRFHQLLWGVGIVIPTDHIQPMLEFVEDIELEYDNKIGEFYTRNGLTVYYTVPSLVDHNDDLESLIAGHGRDVNPEPRVAHRLATGLVEWTNKGRYI